MTNYYFVGILISVFLLNVWSFYFVIRRIQSDIMAVHTALTNYSAKEEKE